MSRRLCLLSAALLAAASWRSAQAEVRISGPVPNEMAFIAGNFQISPDGGTVVFQVAPPRPFDDGLKSPAFLYSTPIDGGMRVQLNSASSAGKWIGYPQFTPDSQRVIYLSNEGDGDAIELFSNSVQGDDHVRLNPPFESGRSISGNLLNLDRGFPPPQITPDGSRVIYAADQREDDLLEIFSVPVAGGEAARLSGNLAAEGYSFLRPVWLSPSDRRLVFSGIGSDRPYGALFGTPWEGGEIQRLTPPIPDGQGGFMELQVAGGPGEPDRHFAFSSNRIAFGTSIYGTGSPDVVGGALATIGPGESQATLVARAPGSVDLRDRILVRESDGAVFYSLPKTSSQSGGVFRADVSDDGVPRVTRLGTFDDPGILLSPDWMRLVVNASGYVYSTPTEGGEPTLLASSYFDDGYRHVAAASFTPDGQHVLLVRDAGTSRGTGLYSVPAAGGEVIPLAEELPPARGIPASQLAIATPDSREVLYLADEDSTGVQGLFTVPVTGGPRIRLNGDLVEGGEVGAYRLSTDGCTVVYAADQRQDGVPELFSVPIRLLWGGFEGGQWSDVGRWANASGDLTNFLPEQATTVFVDNSTRSVTLLNDSVTHGLVEVASLLVGTQTHENRRANLEVELRLLEVAREIEIGERGRLGLGGSTVRVGQSIINRGVFDVPFGGEASLSAEQFYNQESGSVLVSNASSLEISAPLRNEGTITLAPTATLIVKGDFEGRGTIGRGEVTIAGSLRPGLGVGAVRFGGDITLSSVTGPSLVAELGGVAAGEEYDVARVDGAATIHGGLEIQLAKVNGEHFQARIGDSFIVLTAAEGVNGRFSHVLTTSPDWAIRYDDTSVRLEVLSPSGRGDYNGDGRIDQADLDLVLLQGWGVTPSNRQPLQSQWSDYLPVGAVDQAELDAVLLGWSHMIDSSGSVFVDISEAAIPEPSALSLVLFILLSGLLDRRLYRKGA